MRVVNLFGGPGCGKSTTAAGVFSQLKQLGVNCEYAHEWVKWPVWEKRTPIFDDQLYIFAKQHHMLHTLKDNVDIVVTDSPLFLSIVYGNLYNTSAMEKFPKFFELVDDIFGSFNNINYVLERKKAYQTKGRVQTEDEAKDIDDLIKVDLIEHGYTYNTAPGNSTGIQMVTKHIMESIK